MAQTALGECHSAVAMSSRISISIARLQARISFSDSSILRIAQKERMEEGRLFLHGGAVLDPCFPQDMVEHPQLLRAARCQRRCRSGLQALRHLPSAAPEIWQDAHGMCPGCPAAQRRGT